MQILQANFTTYLLRVGCTYYVVEAVFDELKAVGWWKIEEDLAVGRRPLERV